MQIAYEIKEFADYGKGIYALEDIPKGTCIWKYKKNINVIEYDMNASIKYLSKLDFQDAQHFLDMSYGRNNVLCSILDDGQYMNHSTKPNCKSKIKTNGNTYAKRKIRKGEQLFEDYTTFDHPAFLYPLLLKYQCVPIYYKLPLEIFKIDWENECSNECSNEFGNECGYV